MLELDRPGQGRRRPAPHQPRPARARASPRRCRAPRAASSSCCARYDVAARRRRGAVVGRGVTVGRPLGLLLTRKSENATVTLCHTGTRDLPRTPRGADVVVAAAGVARPGHRRHGQARAAVLDVGITRTDAGLVGDVAPDVREVAAYVAPMPGGVGPMTRAMLLANVVEAAERAARPGLTRSARLRQAVADHGPPLGSGRGRAASSWRADHFRRGAVLLSLRRRRSRSSCGCCCPSARRACWPYGPSRSTWRSWRSSPWRQRS